MKYISYLFFLLSHRFLLQLLQCSFGQTVHCSPRLLSLLSSRGVKSIEVFALLAIKVMKAGKICGPHVMSAHLLSQTNRFLFFMLCWSYCPCSLPPCRSCSAHPSASLPAAPGAVYPQQNTATAAAPVVPSTLQPQHGVRGKSEGSPGVGKLEIK